MAAGALEGILLAASAAGDGRGQNEGREAKGGLPGQENRCNNTAVPRADS